MATTQLLEQWARTPTREGLVRLQDAIQAHPLYDAYRDLTGRVVPLLEEGRYAQARSILLEVMPAQALSPGSHALLARCHAGLGDDDGAATERALMRLSMQAILHSGDGSAARPYEVLRTSDEYDTLQALGFRRTHQATMDVEGQLVDVFTDVGGRTVHFLLRGRGRRLTR